MAQRTPGRSAVATSARDRLPDRGSDPAIHPTLEPLSHQRLALEALQARSPAVCGPHPAFSHKEKGYSLLASPALVKRGQLLTNGSPPAQQLRAKTRGGRFSIDKTWLVG
jgi:hypothetical protein